MHILRRMSKHLKAISLGSMALAAVGAIGWGVWHFRESRTMKTDDCRVEASIVSVGSKLAERVTSVDVEEGETVRRGQTLAHLDSRTMQARLMAARSRVKLMQARHDEMLAGFRPQEIESQRARTAQASASLEHARRDYERIEKLVREQAGISSADRDAVRATYLAAQALEKAEQENLALKLEGYREEEKRSAQAQLEAARAELEELEVLCGECVVKSPVDGVVARKLVNGGEMVSSGQKLFSIVDGGDIWLTLDGYDGRVFHGTVYEIGAATYATFSLISTENVSGYFTKVMQRFPVKVSLPKPEDGVVFRPGMQGKVSIDF